MWLHIYTKVKRFHIYLYGNIRGYGSQFFAWSLWKSLIHCLECLDCKTITFRYCDCHLGWYKPISAKYAISDQKPKCELGQVPKTKIFRVIYTVWSGRNLAWSTTVRLDNAHHLWVSKFKKLIFDYSSSHMPSYLQSFIFITSTKTRKFGCS